MGTWGVSGVPPEAEARDTWPSSLSSARSRPTRSAAAAFLLAFLLFVGLTPWMLSHWPVTGDEPHYLLMTYSLLADGDIHMRNNYLNEDYLPFFTGGWLDPHVTVRSDGEWYPVHEIALPVLLTPSFALAGRVGVLYFLSLVAALVALNVWLLSYELTGHLGASWFAWLATTFTIPLLPYTFSIYTEMFAALLVIWVVRQLLTSGPLSGWRWAGIALALVALPWLVIRFLPLALVLLGWLVIRAMARRKVQIAPWLAFLATGGTSLYAISRLNHALYGNATALGASSVGRGSATLAQLIDPLNHLDSFFGWLTDQRIGLFVLAPVYMLLVVGWLFLWRRDRWAALVLGSMLFVQQLSLGFTHFQVRWGVPPRYLVAALPLAGGLIAVSWEALRGIGFRALALALLAVSLLSSGLAMADPLNRVFHTDLEESKLVRLYSGQVGVDLNHYLPMFMPSSRYKDKGWDDVVTANDEPSPYLLSQFRPLASPAGALVPDPQAAGGVATEGAKGTSGILLSGPDVALTPGRYELRYRLKVAQTADIAGAVATINLTLDGQPLSQSEIAAADLAPAGSYHDIAISVDLPASGQLSATLVTTGAAAVTADYMTLIPHNVWPGRLRALAWVVILLGVSIGAYRLNRQERAVAALAQDGAAPIARAERLAGWVAALAGILALALLGWGLWSQWGPRSYEGESLLFQTGGPAADPAASGGAAMLGSVANDTAGWLAYGPYEAFQAGHFKIVVTMRRGPAAQAATIGWIDVTDVDASVILARRDLAADDLAPDQYRELKLDVYNPKWQKLVFRVYFQDVSDLWVDRVAFRRVDPPWSWTRLAQARVAD